jgi:disulfide bond formation protein DsbB
MNSNKLLLNGILVFSILSLSIAYFIQYVLGHKPCNLCIIERVPYIAAIILISLIFIINRYQKIISSLILIFFIFGAVVSFYHFGIEQGFFSESLICELSNNKTLNKEELLNQLKKTEIVSCKDVAFKFLGLSLATINTILSIILSGIMIKAIKNYGKN